MKVSEKELFTALHGEMAARISTRASINISHLTIVLLFASATLLSKNGDMNTYSDIIVCTIPIVSSYFLSLYIHNDRQIGLINHTLSKIERDSDISAYYRFYAIGSKIGKAAFRGRGISNAGVMVLCAFSPLFLLSVYTVNKENDRFPLLTFSIVVIVSVFNIFALVSNSIFRKKVIYWDGEASLPSENK